MRSYGAGLGLVIGAGIGLLFSLFDFGIWWAMPAGASVGLLVGAVIAMQKPRDGHTE